MATLRKQLIDLALTQTSRTGFLRGPCNALTDALQVADLEAEGDQPGPLRAYWDALKWPQIKRLLDDIWREQQRRTALTTKIV